MAKLQSDHRFYKSETDKICHRPQQHKLQDHTLTWSKFKTKHQEKLHSATYTYIEYILVYTTFNYRIKLM